MASLPRSVRGRVRRAMRQLVNQDFFVQFEKQGGRNARALTRAGQQLSLKKKAFVDGQAAEVVNRYGQLDAGEVLYITVTGGKNALREVIAALHKVGLSTTTSSQRPSAVGVRPLQ